MEGRSEAETTAEAQTPTERRNSLCQTCLLRASQQNLPVLATANLTNESDTNADAVEMTSKGLHRRTMTDIDWQQLSFFATENLLHPEPTSQSGRQIRHVLSEGEPDLEVTFSLMDRMDVRAVAEQAERCIQCMMNAGWRVVSHWELPDWLRDNDFLWHGHRPPLPSFRQCFSSMFRVHTETGNIWTHLVGLCLFVIAMIFVYLRPMVSTFQFPSGWQEYIVFGAFFTGAILCLCFSWLFHTVYCHSLKVHSLFSKLDYSGISCLIVGSFVPCLYYGFYCRRIARLVYMTLISFFGICSVVVALWDKFATPKYRPIRAGVFLALGCSGFVPSIHIVVSLGFFRGVEQGALGWMLLMGVLYIVGGLMYAMRVPERFFPGKCNIYFQSHQIFHILVVLAAFIHLHGICQMAYFRLRIGKSCTA